MNPPIAVMGLWHLGLVSAAGLADLGYQVMGLDPDRELIKNLKQGKPPLFEPGLEDLIKKHLASSGLRFEEKEEALKNCKTVLITYDTPVDDQDRMDLTLLDKTLKTVTPFLDADALLIINSQIPVGTCARWQKYISENRPGAAIDVVYHPENIRLGQAVGLFKNPDMMVIGSDSERARKKAEDFFSCFHSEKFYVAWETAEMAKHALNAFFATSISFANELGNLCDAAGADGIQIAQILKKDSRIGKKAQVRPGLGFAGATLARDLRALQDLGKKFRVSTPLLDDVLTVNQKQLDRLVVMVEQYFEGELKGKTLTIFGLTYKPGTSTLRRSSSLEIMERLHQKGVRLYAHDPKADLSEYSGERYFDFFQDPYRACEGSSGILLLTEWPEYKDLDFGRIRKLMSHPFILDAKNHLEGEKLRQLGFDSLEMGRGQLKEGVKR